MVLSDQHRTVLRELLVRYLDAWTPTALHGGRPVTYASDADPDTSLAALRVFLEFADRLPGHRLTMVLSIVDDTIERVPRPDELVVQAAPAPGPIGSGPFFGYYEHPVDLAGLNLGKAAELLLVGSSTVDFSASCRVELVDSGGQPVPVLFTTGVPKHLDKFKDELWSVDEYAGVRYRDPGDEEHTPLDISFTPDLAPLRRAVLRLVAAGERTVAQLRAYTQRETIYRVADLNRLLAPMLGAGALAREPQRGRLTPETVIRSGRG